MLPLLLLRPLRTNIETYMFNNKNNMNTDNVENRKNYCFLVFPTKKGRTYFLHCGNLTINMVYIMLIYQY
jgi:hypothetical protein